MVKTLVALYKDSLTGQRAVEALLDAGFSGDDISLLVKDTSSMVIHALDSDIKVSDGIGFGALVGALVGIGAALVPEIGPVIGSGLVAVALTAGIAAAAGALTGGIAVGLLDLGLNEDEARYYSDRMRLGGTVVSVTTHEQWIEWAERIMARFEPLKIEEREAKWYGRDSAAFDRDESRDTLVSVAHAEAQAVRAEPEIKRVTRVHVYDYKN